MRDFFKGWRRKIGVLTLGLACAFAAAWIRSEVTCDSIQVIINGHKYRLYSYKSSLTLDEDAFYPLNGHLD